MLPLQARVDLRAMTIKGHSPKLQHWWSLNIRLSRAISTIFIWEILSLCRDAVDVFCCPKLRAILNKSWRKLPTKRPLYDHLPPIKKTIQVRRARDAGHCWRSKNELVSDVLLWTPTYGLPKAGRPARTYIQQLCEDTGCNPEDLPEAMSDREKWREMVKDIRAGGTTWWWWWWYIYNL